MYSGMHFTRYTGNIIGAHQKLDRIARRHLGEILGNRVFFPGQRAILHFEGKNGPDGIKIKSPGKNEPWHFFDPLSENTDDFMKLIMIHYNGLIKELQGTNKERAAFEAAWLAHAVVDGLTPAHHFPYEEKISQLRGGKPNSTRITMKEKVVFKGETKRATMHNMFKFWGPRGILMAHIMFEGGFTFIIRPLRFPDARPKKTDLKRISTLGVSEYFMQAAREIAMMNMFEDYLARGWTPKLARQIRQQLAPKIIKTLTVIWYQAVMDASKGET